MTILGFILLAFGAWILLTGSLWLGIILVIAGLAVLGHEGAS